MKYIFIFLYFTLSWLYVIFVNILCFIFYFDFKHKKPYGYFFLTIKFIKNEVVCNNYILNYQYKYNYYLNFIERLIYKSLNNYKI